MESRRWQSVPCLGYSLAETWPKLDQQQGSRKHFVKAKTSTLLGQFLKPTHYRSARNQDNGNMGNAPPGLAKKRYLKPWGNSIPTANGRAAAARSHMGTLLRNGFLSINLLRTSTQMPTKSGPKKCGVTKSCLRSDLPESPFPANFRVADDPLEPGQRGSK
jgi:hypothetical protein